MSSATSSQAAKERHYAVLAHKVNELSRSCVEFQALFATTVRQHKQMTEMAIWQTAQ